MVGNAALLPTWLALSCYLYFVFTLKQPSHVGRQRIANLHLVWHLFGDAI
jgi:hypothetical protein